MIFEGTIIITDPCYITDNFDYIKNTMGDCRIKHYLMRNTIYGDWSCTAYATPLDPQLIIDTIEEEEIEVTDFCNKGTKIGEFAADAGMVGVFLLDEVLKVKPTFHDFIKKYPHCVTVIKDWYGNVMFHQTKKTSTVHVVGNSYNEQDNFYTFQTGF